MDSKKIGVLAGIVGVIGLVAQFVPGAIVSQWVDGGSEGALPMIGTAGQTTVAYELLTDIGGLLVTLALAVWLGVYVARRVDFATEYRRTGWAIASGSMLGVTLGGAPIIVDSYLTSSPGGITIFLLGMVLLRMLTEVALLVIVGALTGAAIAHLRSNDEPPNHPINAAADSPSDSHSDSGTETSHGNAQSVR